MFYKLLLSPQALRNKSYWQNTFVLRSLFCLAGNKKGWPGDIFNLLLEASSGLPPSRQKKLFPKRKTPMGQDLTRSPKTALQLCKHLLSSTYHSMKAKVTSHATLRESIHLTIPSLFYLPNIIQDLPYYSI